MNNRRVKRKQRIQVAGNPLFAKRPSPASTINNPATGTAIFGQFPEIKDKTVEFEAGPIYLRYGAHWGDGSGYGFEHIWQARFRRALTSEEAMPLVTGLVNSILVSGANILYEYNLGSASARSTVFRSPAGVVIVERKLDGQNNVFYSIVTAYSTSQAHGAVIGRLQ